MKTNGDFPDLGAAAALESPRLPEVDVTAQIQIVLEGQTRHRPDPSILTRKLLSGEAAVPASGWICKWAGCPAVSCWTLDRTTAWTIPPPSPVRLGRGRAAGVDRARDDP